MTWSENIYQQFSMIHTNWSSSDLIRCIYHSIGVDHASDKRQFSAWWHLGHRWQYSDVTGASLRLKETPKMRFTHYDGVIMGATASQITSHTIVYSTTYSDAGQRKHQSSASLAFVRGTHRGPVNSPHKWPVTLKMFPFDDVTMWLSLIYNIMTPEMGAINQLFFIFFNSWKSCASLFDTFMTCTKRALILLIF